MQHTYVVLPFTVATGAIFMQFGYYLVEYVHPKVHVFVCGCLFSIPIFISSYVTSFYMFLFLYSFVSGMGYGLVYMLPIRNAWLFFPFKKGLVSGIILMSYSVGAILWIFLSTTIANPRNISPNLTI
jgi:MFS transporter, OFA family, oxalate/formate antiporter